MLIEGWTLCYQAHYLHISYGGLYGHGGKSKDGCLGDLHKCLWKIYQRQPIGELLPCKKLDPG